MCEKLQLAKVSWVMKLTPNKNLVKFSQNKDIDGFVADLSANTQIREELYQIKVTLVPGNSIFEASIKHVKDGDQFELLLGDISRINMYRSQAKCVEAQLPHLRKYCYCK